MEKGESINSLNNDLRAELSAVEIYSAHAETIHEDEIAQGVKAIWEVEKGHADELIQRIEELGGVPAKPGERNQDRKGPGGGQQTSKYAGDAQIRVIRGTAGD